MDLSAEEMRVCDLIRRREPDLLADLRLHVGLPTGGDNADALDEARERLTSRLASLGAELEVVEGDPKPDWLSVGGGGSRIPPAAIARRTRDRPGPPVLIAGHLDTVHDPEDDSFRALLVAPDGKTATGPGCVDMKGGLVIAVAALEALEECGIDCSWTFFLNSDEETGTFHSGAALREVSACHRWGIALEPALTDGSLAIERMGSGQFMVETRGRAAHVGREFERGISAVTKLAECLLEIARMAAPSEGRIVNVGPLEGGAATNAVPDRARAWGNARFADQSASELLASRLDALATPEGTLPGVRVFRAFNRPAKPRTPGTESLALRAREAAESLGQRLPFASTGGVCDGNVMQAAGLPTIDTLGVRGGGLHTRDEWIELASLVERCSLLAVLLARLRTA